MTSSLIKLFWLNILWFGTSGIVAPPLPHSATPPTPETNVNNNEQQLLVPVVGTSYYPRKGQEELSSSSSSSTAITTESSSNNHHQQQNGPMKSTESSPFSSHPSPQPSSSSSLREIPTSSPVPEVITVATTFLHYENVTVGSNWAGGGGGTKQIRKSTSLSPPGRLTDGLSSKIKTGGRESDQISSSSSSSVGESGRQSHGRLLTSSSSSTLLPLEEEEEKFDEVFLPSHISTSSDSVRSVYGESTDSSSSRLHQELNYGKKTTGDTKLIPPHSSSSSPFSLEDGTKTSESLIKSENPISSGGSDQVSLPGGGSSSSYNGNNNHELHPLTTKTGEVVDETTFNFRPPLSLSSSSSTSSFLSPATSNHEKSDSSASESKLPSTPPSKPMAIITTTKPGFSSLESQKEEEDGAITKKLHSSVNPQGDKSGDGPTSSSSSVVEVEEKLKVEDLIQQFTHHPLSPVEEEEDKNAQDDDGGEKASALAEETTYHSKKPSSPPQSSSSSIPSLSLPSFLFEGGGEEEEEDDGTIFSLRPAEIAQYIFLTGDESGVVLTINDLINDLMLDRDDAIKFVEDVKFHLHELTMKYERDKGRDEEVKKKMTKKKEEEKK